MEIEICLYICRLTVEANGSVLSHHMQHLNVKAGFVYLSIDD